MAGLAEAVLVQAEGFPHLPLGPIPLYGAADAPSGHEADFPFGHRLTDANRDQFGGVSASLREQLLELLLLPELEMSRKAVAR